MAFDFTKSAVLDTLDEVPEEFRGAYTEAAEGDNKGKFVVNPNLKGLVDAYTGVNTRLNQVSKDKTAAGNESAKRRVALRSIADTLAEFGIDVDPEAEDAVEKVKTALSTLTAEVKGGKELKVNLDKIKQDYEKRLAEKDAEYKSENQKMKTSLEEYMIGQAATAALAEAKVVANGVDLLLPQISRYAKVLQEEGKFVVRVVDEQGDVRSDGKGGWLSVKDFVTELKTKFPMAFQSETKGGSGVTPSSVKKPVKAVDDDDMSPTQKIVSGLKKLGR